MDALSLKRRWGNVMTRPLPCHPARAFPFVCLPQANPRRMPEFLPRWPFRRRRSGRFPLGKIHYLLTWKTYWFRQNSSTSAIRKNLFRDDRYYGVRLTSSCSFSKLGSEPIQPKQNSHTTIDDCSFGNVRKNFRLIVVDRSDYISKEPTHFIATNSLPHYTLHIIFMHISTTPHPHKAHYYSLAWLHKTKALIEFHPSEAIANSLTTKSFRLNDPWLWKQTHK